MNRAKCHNKRTEITIQSPTGGFQTVFSQPTAFQHTTELLRSPQVLRHAT